MYHIHAETDDFILIDKHPGASVHNESGQGLLLQIRTDLKNDAITLVHRLDKATSGLLLCAKHKRAVSELSQLFEQRQVEKYYLALSDKKPKKKQGLIKGDMQRSRNGSWRLSQTQYKPAITQFFSYGLPVADIEGSTKKAWRLFILKPHTGKTHQLRVALKSQGAAIFGDSRYGSDDLELPEQGGERMYLHAYCLCFHYQGQQYQFCSLPRVYPSGQSDQSNQSGEQPLIAAMRDFIKQRAELLEPWQLNWPKV